MKTKTSTIAAVLGVGLAMVVGPVQSSVPDWTWNLNSDTYSDGLAHSPGAGIPTLDLDGYTATSNSVGVLRLDPKFHGATAGYGVCGDSSTATVVNTNCPSSPNHAMDNDANREALLLSFGQSVSLTQLTLGWARHGSSSSTTAGADISVLAYVGSGAPITSGTTTFNNIDGNSSWKLVGNFGNVAANSVVTLGSGGGYTGNASYWLIAAYNSIFLPSGGACSGNACTSASDYIKLLSVGGNRGGQVPEPTGLLLFGTALIGVIGLRRREMSIQA